MEAGIMLYVGCKVNVYDQIKVLKELGVRHTFINAKHPELKNVLAAERLIETILKYKGSRE